jgi:hypothetical protein
VDGGVLSNLPSFVFSDIEGQDGRVLAFCLQSNDPKESSIATLSAYVKAFADTLIEGAQELQLRLQKEVHVITISTGMVKATDFDRMHRETIAELFQNGVNATKQFFDEETLKVKTISRQTDICSTYMHSYNVIAQTVEMPINQLGLQVVPHDIALEITTGVRNSVSKNQYR